MAKTFTATRKINGVTYTAQFNGISAALRSVDETYIDGTNVTSVVKMTDYILKNVIVEPSGLTADSFDTIDECNEVVRFGTEVMQGKFRPEAEQEPAKAKGKG